MGLGERRVRHPRRRLLLGPALGARRLPGGHVVVAPSRARPILRILANGPHVALGRPAAEPDEAALVPLREVPERVDELPRLAVSLPGALSSPPSRVPSLAPAPAPPASSSADRGSTGMPLWISWARPLSRMARIQSSRSAASTFLTHASLRVLPLPAGRADHFVQRVDLVYGLVRASGAPRSSVSCVVSACSACRSLLAQLPAAHDAVAEVVVGGRPPQRVSCRREDTTASPRPSCAPSATGVSSHGARPRSRSTARLGRGPWLVLDVTLEIEVTARAVDALRDALARASTLGASGTCLQVGR